MPDVEGFRAINSLAGRFVTLDAFFIFGAQHAIVLMAALLLAYAAAAWKTSHFEGRVENLYHVGWTVALAYAAERIIGFLYFRARPFVSLEGVVKLIEKSPLEKSFPSGHATAAFAMAFGLMLHNRKWGWALILLALYVSLSRVAVGVHYPSDVAGGMIVAALAAAVTAPVKKAVEPYLELFPVFRKYRRQA